jgi:hypothetical protein
MDSKDFLSSTLSTFWSELSVALDGITQDSQVGTVYRNLTLPN